LTSFLAVSTRAGSAKHIIAAILILAAITCSAAGATQLHADGTGWWIDPTHINDGTTLIQSIFEHNGHGYLLDGSSHSEMGAVQKEECDGEILNKVSSVQIPFIGNKGQIKDGSVKYYAKTLGGTLFVTEDGDLVYSLPKFEKENETRGWVIKESFVGSSILQVTGERSAITKVNYFKGKDSSQWRSDIQTYNLVSLGEIYEGLELNLKAYGNNVEKLFHVKSGADPETIKVRIDGAEGLSVNQKGELEVETGRGVVKFTKPVAYQEEDVGRREYVEVAYAVEGDEYGFKVGDYDRTKELVIDQLLASTFLGGSDIDNTGVMASISEFVLDIDKNGNVYVVGNTISSDFPATPGAYDTTINSLTEDIFIAKFDSNLQNLLSATFIGCNLSDYAGSISIADSGNVYIVGTTAAPSDFPTTPCAYDTTYNNPTGFVVFIAKFDNNLQNLLASTFLGSGGSNYPTHIFVDNNEIHFPWWWFL
jgi:hypothetical protein